MKYDNQTLPDIKMTKYDKDTSTHVYKSHLQKYTSITGLQVPN